MSTEASITGLVSAIIPTYNYGKYVSEAVDSILEQSYGPIEIIVVDDGSTDNTAEVLKAYGDKIHYIHKKNAGLSAARNTGIAAAKGEFLAFLDADDKWKPNKIELQVELAYKTGHPVILCTRNEADLAYENVDFDNCFFHPSGLGSNALIKRDRLLEVGGFDEELKSVEDREMMLRLTRNGSKAGFLHGNYSFIRVHDENMSNNPKGMEDNFQITLNKVFAWDEMKGNYALKARAKSYMWFDSIYNYYADDQLWMALKRCLQSIMYWPIPVGRYYPRPGMRRTKLLILIVLSIFGFKRAERATN
jgi:glycosyltransferase involved in cell wall biosynthesis